MALRSLIDTALEATIVGSFTKVGPAVRSRAFDWSDDRPMDGSVVVLTGGSSGIGKAAARRLVAAGAEVHLTSRTLARAEETADELNEAGGRGRAFGAEVDTADLASIDRLADHVRAETDAVDVLIHNAGALSDTHSTNDAGLEQTLASHLVGPYALTRRLRDHLSTGARVLWMASGGMYTQGLDVDRLEMGPDGYRGAVAYARAKRAQVELVRHLGPQWTPDVVMHALHPGWVDTQGVVDALPGFHTVVGPLLRDPDEGADTLVWLAAGGADDGPAGRFWHDRRPRSTAYLPGTDTDDRARTRLVEWLDEAVAGIDAS